MFNSLSNLLTWTTTSTTPQDEWNTWEVWQRVQPPAHYEKSDIFQYYLIYRPEFQVPQHAATTGHHNKAFKYCFGDFTPLVVSSSGSCDIVSYCNLLLDVYDICKGFTRRFKGDPTGIILIREIVIKRDLTPLYNRDFSKYCYDYGLLHAHTVAQYSLSTLIMRLLTNYLYYACSRKYFPHITSEVCEKAYRTCAFGDRQRVETIPITTSVPRSIPISPQPGPNDEGKAASSWPGDPASYLRCNSCKRVTENRWGTFNSCLDCHMKRICSKCGATPVVIISVDKLPKCRLHCELNMDSSPGSTGQ
ncbi:Hypothetical protein HVR_LOCUS158 [uncultured virus]|nr:Hypothetical protein HVR_LOCUS158 [uncultured virus]